jgi:hypothetical protein
MSIVSQLSSQVGDRSEESNKIVVEQCLKNNSLLKEIAQGLQAKDVALIGDCAEVFTQVAEVSPEMVAPYAKDLVSLLEHKNTRVRWEIMHALALIASFVPNEIEKILPQLHRMSLSDSSTIVRDYSVIAVSNYAKSSKKAAQDAFSILKRILEVWKEKQAARALKGLQNVAETNPGLTREVVSLAKPFENNEKGTVKKAAKELLNSLQNSD